VTHMGRDAVTLDLFSKVVGWSMGESLEQAGPIRVLFCPRQSKLVLLDHKTHLAGMVAGCA
jgi:hypothetical protein